MKSLIVSSLFLLISLQAFALELPECKDNTGSVLSGSVDQLKVVMRSRANRPQVMVTGVISKILPEDHSGLPHQKYTIVVNKEIQILIISNLDFGRIPVAIGKSVSVCGEFKKVAQGMVHWTHFDPHGGHPDGFTILDGKLYGDTEVR